MVSKKKKKKKKVPLAQVDAALTVRGLMDWWLPAGSGVSSSKQFGAIRSRLFEKVEAALADANSAAMAEEGHWRWAFLHHHLSNLYRAYQENEDRDLLSSRINKLLERASLTPPSPAVIAMELQRDPEATGVWFDDSDPYADESDKGHGPGSQGIDFWSVAVPAPAFISEHTSKFHKGGPKAMSGFILKLLGAPGDAKKLKGLSDKELTKSDLAAAEARGTFSEALTEYARAWSEGVQANELELLDSILNLLGLPDPDAREIVSDVDRRLRSRDPFGWP